MEKRPKLIKVMAWHRTCYEPLSEPIDGHVFWRRYASLGLDESSNMELHICSKLINEYGMVVEISYTPWFMKDIKNNARVTVNNDFFVTREAVRQWFSLVTNNDFFCHEWGDSTMIFTSDDVTSENHCRIASRVTKKSLFTVTNVLFYFLHAILCHEHTNPLRTIIERSFRHCC